MSNLTVKEEKFARLYVELGNGSEAYRQAYNPKPDIRPETVWEASCKLAKKEKVATRIQELQDQAMVTHSITMETLLNDLRNIQSLATAGKKYAPAVSAVNSQMKLLGLDKTTINHTSDDGTMSPNLDLDLTKLDDDEIDELKRLLQKATR